jgi:aryl-alcohol dehydrogenase-like predicted oxidoreductase
MITKNQMNRRKFVKTSIVAAAATAIVPGLAAGCVTKSKPAKRVFGKLGFEVTTLGLGGQASIQWTPDDVDPVSIILKAFDLGINYFDTSNLYGPSQTNYGKAFRELKLVPGEAGYNEELRKSIFLTSKTHLRYAKGEGDIPGVSNWTNGEPGTHTIDDLKRSLSQMFGDDNGNYPEGAYIDMMLFHNLNRKEEVDAIYEGVENTDPDAERIGALAALRDYRDGTNMTGLNPNNEKLIRHIGFSGHFDPSVNMYMIQRDNTNLLDAMLVAINANDRLMFNMQHNVIPLAAAKNMGVIGMKVFADGAMYTKPAEWSNNPSHVVRIVGSPALPSKPLIKYSLTTPGVHLVIIGIGQISDNPQDCQLVNNLEAAQVLPDGMSPEERVGVEAMAKKAKEGKTNYFQMEAPPLTAPGGITITRESGVNSYNVILTWHTAFAADSPLKSYEVWRDGNKVGELAFTPQVTTDPYKWAESLPDSKPHTYVIKIIDSKGREALSEPVTA